MKEIKEVELTISSLTNDLNLGLTWLEKDNIGYGSIQSKYDATEMQIMVIKQHPKLVNIEPIRVFFTLRDDTVEPVEEEQPVKETMLDLGFMVPPTNNDGNPPFELHSL